MPGLSERMTEIALQLNAQRDQMVEQQRKQFLESLAKMTPEQRAQEMERLRQQQIIMKKMMGMGGL